jgi:Flp pilus assembly protein TadG
MTAESGVKPPTAFSAAALRDERAQGVVEFALLITTLLFFFLGTVDFSRFMYYDSAIRNAARVGAEVAGNYCNVPGCGIQSAATPNDDIMQATYCEAAQNQAGTGTAAVNLSPKVNCTPCTTASCDPCSSSSPYLGACANCQTDICISPSSRVAGDTVTIYVGYNFTPVSFYMKPFFSQQTCFPSGSTSESYHTLCAYAVGRVSEH